MSLLFRTESNDPYSVQHIWFSFGLVRLTTDLVIQRKYDAPRS
jgi:hypothetical protein